MMNFSKRNLAQFHEHDNLIVDEFFSKKVSKILGDENLILDIIEIKLDIIYEKNPHSHFNRIAPLV